MRVIYLLFLCLCIGNFCHAQIWKRVVTDVKNRAESRVRSKVIQKTDQAIDSLLTRKKKEEINSKSGQPPAQQSASATTSSNNESEVSTIGEGFITMSVSANQVFRGGMILVTGTSVKYGELKSVELRVEGPDTDEIEAISLHENGTYTVGWTAEQSGEFTLTVKSSDGKDQKSDKVFVHDVELIDSFLVMENIEWTHKTYDKLKNEAERVKNQTGSKDDADLEKKMDVVEENVESALKLFSEIKKAAASLKNTINKGAPISPNLSGNLSQLNDKLKEQSKQMKQVYEATDRQPYDNTICEYLVMLNEACAAFSTFTNVWSKSVATILKNIVLDKGVPKAVEVANDKAGANLGDFGAADKAAGKLFATAQLDAEGLFGKLSAASFTGDITQFATDVLMKKYCGVFKGELSHKYTIIYRNSNKVIWWQYSYTTKAAVTFRYPKNSSGDIIKMKGNIEGNAVSFAFTEDIEQEDEFREKMKSRAKLHHIPLIKPVSVPFSSAQEDGLGFGAVARTVATPACFNIPVDADYNTNDATIKLSLNDAIIDFSPLVKYTYGYVAIIYGVAPLVTRVDFPINKARPTLNAVVSRNHQLTVTKDAKNNLLVKGGGERHIGSEGEPIEHKISYTLTAKNDN
jgi:hypothetical protein